MRKPDSLRAALTAALPEYARDPHNLAIFVDKGRLVSRATGALGYEWRYTLRLEFHDCTSGPDAIAVPLLLWLRQHQPERLLDFARDDSALGFAADIIDETTWDLVWTIELTEAVSVTAQANGGWQVVHLPEPALDPMYAGTEPGTMLDELWFADTQLLP